MTSKAFPIRAAAIGLAFLISACAGTGTATRTGPAAPAATPSSPAAPAPAPGQGAHDNLNAVVWMQTAAEYRAATLSIFGAATALLDRALADPGWDALPPEERTGRRVENLLPAIIVDADEAVIDNSPYQARLIETGQAFDADTWYAWTQERRATAVPGALEFLRTAAQRGITVFYVTNRAASEKAATYDNLRALGFPLSDPEDTVLTIDENQGWSSEKRSRRQFVGEQYRVLMMFGDNLGDFVAGSRGHVQARAGQVQGHQGWWGTRWFMLPNPSYGGWESAVVGDAPDASARKRRALRSR
ncbi:MAG: acid phosphatase [Xanthomonadales bacterium]|nr:acid phosphatase [Xanthomonadales bacterium]